jgi:hypothetical protein
MVKTRAKVSMAVILGIMTCLAISRSGKSMEDLLDRSRVFELANISQQKSNIPNGVGAFRLKKEMHRNEGWIERDSRLFLLAPEGPIEELIDDDGRLRALEDWAGIDGDRVIRVWIDGLPFDMSLYGLGTEGAVTAEEFAQFCSLWAAGSYPELTQ